MSSIKMMASRYSQPIRVMAHNIGYVIDNKPVEFSAEIGLHPSASGPGPINFIASTKLSAICLADRRRSKYLL